MLPIRIICVFQKRCVLSEQKTNSATMTNNLHHLKFMCIVRTGGCGFMNPPMPLYVTTLQKDVK